MQAINLNPDHQFENTTVAEKFFVTAFIMTILPPEKYEVVHAEGYHPQWDVKFRKINTQDPWKTIEFKADLRYHETGNLAIETHTINYYSGKLEPTGLCLTEADTIIYMMPIGDDTVKWMSWHPDTLKTWVCNTCVAPKMVGKGGRSRCFMAGQMSLSGKFAPKGYGEFEAIGADAFRKYTNA
jgi:hypothetical protein